MRRFVSDPTSVVQSEQPASTVSLEAIVLPPKAQPRRYFAPEKMAQLVASIQEYGILEPIIVRPLGNGLYELIAGERRLRAAKELRLDEIPIISRDCTDQAALQIALMENLQRDDLSPIEETEAILSLLAIAIDSDVEDVKSIIYQSANAKNRGQELKEHVSLRLQKIESCLKEIGRLNLESLRSSRLPLLNLPTEVLDALRRGELEYTKARAISRIKDEECRQGILESAIEQQLSLTQIKARIKESTDSDLTSTLGQKIETSSDRLSAVSRQFKKIKKLNDPKKQKRLEKLLDELELLIGEA